MDGQPEVLVLDSALPAEDFIQAALSGRRDFEQVRGEYELAWSELEVAWRELGEASNALHQATGVGGELVCVSDAVARLQQASADYRGALWVWEHLRTEYIEMCRSYSALP